ncbi:ATP-binding protein [Bdellovibrio sp. HCB185ZH]|uniref:ATP-binding protein n=1 Tax=Bdellovibrio sp. HCB185ZH TaxID=3394235 RepID=UPI0039A62958
MPINSSRKSDGDYQQSMETMIRTSPSFMALLSGPNFIFEEANDQYLQLIGKKDIIGRPMLDVIPEIGSQGFVEILNEVAATGKPYIGSEVPIYLNRVPGQPSEKRYVDFVYQVHPSSKEGLPRIFVHGNDVTERVLARDALDNERRNFRNLFKQTPEMVCILSGPEHLFEFVNEAHIRVLGFDATGKTVREAQPESVEIHSILDDVFRTGKTAELKEIPVTVTNRLRYFNLTYAARYATNGAISGVMILGTEVTDEVRAREELKKAKEEADKANQSKTTFLANVSHEIRTPLGAILGFSELLSHEVSAGSEAADYIERISKNAQQLRHLIDELLDLSKIEANRLEIERLPVDLNSLVQDVISSLSPLAQEKSLKIEVINVTTIPPRIMTDPMRLKQILTNLVGNSIKFTEKGTVRIELAVAKKGDGNELQIRVIDTGIGLAPEQVQRLFKPFSQADSSITRKFGGTGLGLVLSRQLALLLKGDLTLEKSAPGQGSTFTLTIAVGTDQEIGHREIPVAKKESGSGENFHLQGRKILIVDDVPDNQTLVRLYLNRGGAIHESAYDGREAVEKALNGDFDIILMDLQMPKMDGHSAARELRQQGYAKPIIALTAHALRGEREKCLAGGFNEYITKPIDKATLLGALNRLLKH